jgi:AICAR transformylase/IMP cyclohydrolase PurH
VLAEMKGGGISEKTRFALAKKAFAHTAAYDGAIANYLSSLNTNFPETLTLQFTRLQELRYGENPISRQRSIATRSRLPAASRATSRSRARSSPTTTSPTPTRRGNA